jgi:signal transduction histidine kinase
MKESKAVGMFSRMQPAEWKQKGVPRNICGLPASRNRSLHVSIHKRADNAPSPQCMEPLEEERHARLVSLGENVGRLAHDIRNPLSSIEWFATLLGRNDHSQEERQELADSCIQAVRTLDHLVANMLVLSVPLEAQQESIHMSTLLDDVELLATYPLRKKRLTIHRRDSGRLSSIRGHESLMKQMFLNLLMNAIHASKPDSSIDIHYRRDARLIKQEEGEVLAQGVILHIRDYGCGMSEEELSHVFRPFYSTRKGGTGLGLSIVNQVMQIHHGVIEITSQEGKGTTVELFFPQ